MIIHYSKILVSLFIVLCAKTVLGQCVQEWIPGSGLPQSSAVNLQAKVFAAHDREYVFVRASDVGSFSTNDSSRSLFNDGSGWREITQLPGAPAAFSTNLYSVAATTRDAVYFFAGTASSTDRVPVYRWDGQTFTATPFQLSATSVFVGQSREGDQVFLSARESSTSPQRLFRLVNSQWQVVSSVASMNELLAIAFLDDVAGGRVLAVRSVNNQFGLYQLDASGWVLVGPFVYRERITAYFSPFRLLAQGVGESARLIVSGPIDAVGGRTVKHIAVYQGGQWAPLGDGLEQPPMAICNDPGFPERGVLIASPDLDGSGTQQTLGNTYLRRLTPNGWQSVSPAIPPLAPDDLAFGAPNVNLASARSVIVDGSFATITGPSNQQGLVRWDGAEWTGLGPVGNVAGTVNVIEVLDSGDGPRMHVAGSFFHNAAASIDSVAAWNGTGWYGVGTGLRNDTSFTHGSDSINALGQLIGGPAGTILAGASAGVSPLGELALVNDTWQQLGGNVSGYRNGYVNVDLGNGMYTYSMKKGGGPLLRRWNGSVWSDIPNPSGLSIISVPYAITSFDDGRGTALYVTGVATNSTLAQNTVFRYNGTTWEVPRTGIEGIPGSDNQVGTSFHIWQDGNGVRLLLGGYFTGQAQPGVAKYLMMLSGTSWVPFAVQPPGIVTSMTTHDFGNGPELVALLLQSATGQPSTYALSKSMRPYRFTAGGWVPFAEVRLVATDLQLNWHFKNPGVIRSVDGELWMGGPFRSVNGITSYYVARYGCRCTADVNQDRTLDLFDYLDFATRFAGQEASADFNRDSVIDFFDYLDFVASFTAGCG